MCKSIAKNDMYEFIFKTCACYFIFLVVFIKTVQRLDETRFNTYLNSCFFFINSQNVRIHYDLLAFTTIIASRSG